MPPDLDLLAFSGPKINKEGLLWYVVEVDHGDLEEEMEAAEDVVELMAD